MTDDIVPLHPEDFVEKIHYKLLIVEVGDIFDELNANIRRVGEVPAIDVYRVTPELDAFLMDIYNDLMYLPQGQPEVAFNIVNVLDRCGQYFNVHHLSHAQRQMWLVFAQRLVDRFCEYRLYGRDHIHQYDYLRLDHRTLVLEQFT